jgi:8-oxo-dGTP diphosphatase
MSSDAKTTAERWTVCSEGHVHWGANGAAGFLFRNIPYQGDPHYLLQQRSEWVEFGGRWGIPGGAIQDDETPEMAARREAGEEIGPLPPYRIVGIDVQDCGGGWKFHILKADVGSPFPAFSVQETDATGWFTLKEMRRLPLHPAFRKWLDERASSSESDF